MRVLAPEWVSKGPFVDRTYSDRLKASDFSWLERPPALRYRAFEKKAPTALQGEVRLIGSRGQAHVAPCVVASAAAPSPPLCVIAPHFLLNAYLDVDAGLVGSIKYVNDLASEYADYFGNVGVNFELQGINEAAATAFNWAKLIFEPPGTTEVLAFDVLQNALKPLLLKGEKPDATQFPHAQVTPSRREMNLQYVILCKRIRNRENVRKSFSLVTTFNVAPVAALRTVSSILFMEKFQLPALPYYLISSFVHVLPVKLTATSQHAATSQHGRYTFAAKAVGQTFAIKGDSLCLPGAYGVCKKDAKGHLRKGGQAALQRNRVTMRHGGGKTFAVALSAPMQGRLLRIESENRVGDPSKVARAIDLQPEINRQNQAGEHCWHACDLHHLCRFLHPRESACERWGSLIHRLYESDQNYPPWRMAARLFLREAGLGFVGRPEDEDFISALVDLMEEGAGRNRGV